MAKQITNAKAVQAKSRSHTVEQIGAGQFLVTSGATGNGYTVELLDQGAACTCDWAKYRPRDNKQSGCSHVVSVYNHIAQQATGGTVSAWTNDDDARRQRRPSLNIGDGITLTWRKS